MEIVKAEHLGFCFGVKRAIKMAENELENNKILYCAGEIIHNKDVNSKLEEKGLKIIDSITDDINDKFIIRSHGVPKETIDILEKKNIDVIDATCPKVKKIHNIVEKKSLNEYEILITGNPKHPEVKGILGWVKAKSYIIEKVEDFLKIEIDTNKKYCLVSQTTFNINIFDEIIDIINKMKYNNIIIYNTICEATKNRQKACAKLAKDCDLVLVIGGKNSSNTKKLLEISQEFCNNCYHIENYKEIPYKNIHKNIKIGVTAGASTPDWIIEEVIQNVRK